MANGLGFGNEDEEDVLTSGDQAAQALGQLQADQQPSGIRESFKNDPLGSLGTVFSDIAAGAQGKPSPSAGVRADKATLGQRQAEFAVERVVKGVKLLTDVLDVARETSPAERKQFLTGVGGQVAEAFPEIKAILNDFTFEEADTFANLSVFPEVAQLFAADFDTGAQFVGDKDKMDGLMGSLLNRDSAAITQRLQELTGGEEVTYREFLKLNKTAEGFVSPEFKTLMRFDPRVAEGLVSNIPTLYAEDSEQAEFKAANNRAALQRRASGGTVDAGRFDISDQLRADINAMTPEKAEENLTAGQFGRTEADVALERTEAIVPRLQDQEIALRNFVRESNRVMKMISDDPGVATTARGLVTLGASAAANLDEVMSLFGTDDQDVTQEFRGGVTAEQLGDSGFRSRFESAFPGLAGASAELASATFNLVYQRLALRGERARSISDRDLALNTQNLGANLDDPRQVIASLKEAIVQVTGDFQTNLDVLGRDADLSQFDISDLTDDGSTEFTSLSDEAFQEALNNATAENRDELRKELERRQQ